MKTSYLERKLKMDKETKTKLLIVTMIAAFLMLFTFQGKAEDTMTKEPASITDETSVPTTSETTETTTEESAPVYYPSSEDSSSEDFTFEE